jgi:serine/threonine protein kinase
MKDNGYKMLHKIGEGPASTVYLVSNRVGQHFAAKVVRYDVTQYKASKCSQRDWQNFHNEATQLSMLSHPCIIKLRECFVNGEDDLVLVTDYCPGSTLSDYIKSSTQLLPETLILDWLVQLCLALRYLHRNGIIHRDIKSSNIFFTDQGRVKLGDFGACRSLQEGELLLSTAGTPSYLPPEMLASDYGEAAQKGFSNKQDMWALGIVLY